MKYRPVSVGIVSYCLACSRTLAVLAVGVTMLAGLANLGCAGSMAGGTAAGGDGAGGGDSGGGGAAGDSSQQVGEGGGAGGSAGGAGKGGGAPDAGVAMGGNRQQGGQLGGGGSVGGRTDGGVADVRPVDPMPPDAGADQIPTIVAVGYGAVRIISRDLGLTWTSRVSVLNEQFGDETHLLRTVVWANGIWVAAGQRIFTSPDGVTWTERNNGMQNWIGGVAFGNGLWVGAGGCGWSVRSLDGVTWVKGGQMTPVYCPESPNSTARRSETFGGGLFGAAGDDKKVYTSADGKVWSVLPGLTTSGGIAYCNGAFASPSACPRTDKGHGVYIRPTNGIEGKTIERSTDGTRWTTVHTDSNVIVSVGFGFSPK